MLTKNDRYNPFLSANTVKALGASNLERIDPQGEEGLPSEDLFGQENKNTWCYYFEKADLARQTKDWPEVTRLYNEAETKGYEPGNGIEMMPFIEGFARTGGAKKSLQLTIDATKKTDNISPFLCDNWNRFALDLFDDASVQEAYQTFSKDYGCSIYLEK
ncbi:MAG: hypothetical protein C0401_11190 [Anaerolinea sp.]|nr:hypothetical protein [Anaerolinea sp.]